MNPEPNRTELNQTVPKWTLRSNSNSYQRNRPLSERVFKYHDSLPQSGEGADTKGRGIRGWRRVQIMLVSLASAVHFCGCSPLISQVIVSTVEGAFLNFIQPYR